MKLNKQGRDELRSQIEQKLMDVPEGQRVHLDKEVLEELLFETVKYEDIIVKIPFWNGNFLSKIDLSEVDFEDVSWAIISNTRIDDAVNKNYYGGCFDYLYDCFIENKAASEYISEKLDTLVEELFIKSELYEIHEYSKKYLKCRVNYSNTNAKIDFTKSFERKNHDNSCIEISGINFSGTDLSSVNMDDISFFTECDLKDTNLKITEDFIKKHNCPLWSSSFENIDMSDVTVNARDLFNYDETESMFYDCNLKNTKINIVYSNEDLETCGEEFAKQIKKGYLNGCYINGKLVNTKSNEELRQIANQKLQEYKQYKDSLFNGVSSSIDEQIKGIKK